MPKPCYRMRENEAGVSEVFGTLLILAMTTVLFATIIIWVSNIPTPPALSKLDMDASYSPIYLSGNGANLTIRHKGGEDIHADDIRVYVTITRAGLPSTTVLKVEGTYTSGPLTGKPYGLVDGRDTSWNIGERWQWSNYSTLPTDTISAIIVDHTRNRVMWSGDVLGAPGAHPPIFLDKWADRIWTTPTPDVPWTANPFHVMARMSDSDNDLVRVNATLTIFFGTPDFCALPQPMTDDGTNGDLIPGDGTWTLYRTCMDSPSLTWDGSVILFNATDAKGHYTASRLILTVAPNPEGTPGGGTFDDNGRPPNLRYNGLQGFNIFNGSEWTNKEFSAIPTHTFKENEQVVVVVGSLVLSDTRGQNRFTFYDPFSGIPAESVVYGASKTVTVTTKPSNNQAFTFHKFVNGYNVFIFTFDLNNPSTVGTNFYVSPSHPPNYFFGQYPLTMTIVDSTGAQFVASDAINVTDLSGNKRNFPLITTYFDAGFTGKSTQFDSTDTIYVQVSMFTTDANNLNLLFGNMILRDFRGGTQLFKAPINGRNVNAPICPAAGACTPGTNIFTVVGDPTFAYRFAINLSRADQDAWVDGVQTYSLTLSSVDDADEQYANLAVSLVIVAPLYKLDLVVGNVDTTNSAWGTHDFSYAYTAVNGIDRWRKDRLHSGPVSSPNSYTKAIKFLDYDSDGDLDVAASVVNWETVNNVQVFLFRQDLDNFGNPLFTRFKVGSGSTVVCNDLATGDVTADGNPEIICGGNNGMNWYFRNDGAWTKVDIVDSPARSSPVNSVDLGDFDGDGDYDLAAARSDGKITYYLNLDGQGGFVNAPVTDDWFPESEQTAIGNVVANSILQTYVSDDVRESVREATITESVLTGATVNAEFATDASSWTYADWEQPASASGSYVPTGGSTNGYVDLTMARVSGAWVSGYWYQAFGVSGAGPWTVTVDLNHRFIQKGSMFNQMILYAFVDSSSAAPVLADAVWSTTYPSSASPGPWTDIAPVSADSRVTGPGTYYLKVVARTQYNTGGSGSTTTIAGFDNVTLNWTSSSGPVSEMKHYWRIQQLPNRPASTYTINIEGLAATSPDGDTFSIAWAVGVPATPPADSNFATVATITTPSDSSFSSSLPTTLGGQFVWVRVVDTNRDVGNVDNDTVSVDRLYIRVASSGGSTGTDVDLASGGGVTSLDADDVQGDGFADVVAGTSNGKIYRLYGSSGGLINQGQWHTQGSSAITGIRWVNATTAGIASLEIAFSTGSNAYVITGSGSLATIAGPLAAGGTVSAFAAGDVDGDGDDDFMLATSAGGVRYWRNLGGALSWDRSPNGIDIDGLAVQIYDIDLGDLSNSAYRGR